MSFKEQLQKAVYETEPIAIDVSKQVDILMDLLDRWQLVEKQIKLNSYLQAEYNKNEIISKAQIKIIKLADRLNS